MLLDLFSLAFFIKGTSKIFQNVNKFFSKLLKYHLETLRLML